MYAWQHQKKSKYIATHPKISGMTKFISVLADNLPEVNPVVMNYKMRHNKNQPARDSLVWPDHFSVINICGGRETENMVGHARLRARAAMEGFLIM